MNGFGEAQSTIGPQGRADSTNPMKPNDVATLVRSKVHGNE